MQELIQWMEAIKPKSAASVIQSQQVNTATQQNISASLLHAQSVTTIVPENSEHAYQPLPHSFTHNPRLSMGSDGRSSPSSPRVRTTSNSSARSQSPLRSSSPGGRVNPPQVKPETHPARTSLHETDAPQKHAVSARQSLPGTFTPSLPLYTLSQRRKSCDIPLTEDPVEALPDSPQQDTSLNTDRVGQDTPPNTSLPLDLDFSDDEFLDFGDDGTYMNDPQDTLHTLRSEIRTLRLSDGNTTAMERGVDQETPPNTALLDRVGQETSSIATAVPSVLIIPDTPDGTFKAEYIAPLSIPSQYSESPANPSLYCEKPEYRNDSNQGNQNDDSYLGNDTSQDGGGFDCYSSPAVTRRSIKSKNVTGNVNYCVTVPTPDSEDDSEDNLPNLHIKSTAPATTDHTLHRDNSNSFLSTESSPANPITTLRIREWVRKITIVKKAFVDPEDQEVGALDKFLIEHATCLPKDNFTLLQKIGNGAFGEVWKARCETAVNGDDVVAVKCLKEGATDKHRHDFYGEAALLGQFRHANVIALHGVILRDTSPWIVIEYAENGALKGFVKKHGENRHSNQLLNYCRDIVRGMKYLSERGYIHRDLAARNVLLTRMEVCKIADFGLSRKLGDDDEIYVSKGGMVAIKWTAPEGVLGASYSSASDVWSCAITMWEVFSDGANPWSGQSNEDAFRRIRKGGRLAKPEKCPLDIYKTMLKCWEANPLERPTFAELDRLLYDPSTDNVGQPLYENTEGFVQYVNLQYENMQDVQGT
ncbi:ephrin type-A receptor 4-like isoform X2 [Bolinopsis microptera]|uniref:ephrin type-A receptor 4-like isoform X2 n=1 Tax=Bolinopsis microptera TaxID=2820187 RepID=UPI0030791115